MDINNILALTLQISAVISGIVTFVTVVTTYIKAQKEVKIIDKKSDVEITEKIKDISLDMVNSIRAELDETKKELEEYKARYKELRKQCLLMAQLFDKIIEKEMIFEKPETSQNVADLRTLIVTLRTDI